MLEEFKKFALRGNAVDLAIGVIIGASFGRIVESIVGDIFTPIVGAIARDGQSCCLRSSLTLASVCGPVLALGLIAQVVPLPFGRGQRTVRIGLWTFGWLVWLMSGPVSFLHAFS